MPNTCAVIFYFIAHLCQTWNHQDSEPIHRQVYIYMYISLNLTCAYVTYWEIKIYKQKSLAIFLCGESTIIITLQLQKLSKSKDTVLSSIERQCTNFVKFVKANMSYCQLFPRMDGWLNEVNVILLALFTYIIMEALLKCRNEN